MEKKVNMKELTFKQKIRYIWDYYKWQIIIPVIVIAILSSYLHSVLIKKDAILHIIMINYEGTADYEAMQETGFYEYLEQEGYDTKKTEIEANTALIMSADMPGNGYQEQIALNALLTSGEYGMLMSDQDLFEKYAKLEFFQDLRRFYDEDFLEKYKDCLIYTKSEETGEEYPCGFYLDKNNWYLKQTGFYKDCCVGFNSSDDDVDIRSDFMVYLLEHK